MNKKMYSDPELQVRRFEQIDLIGNNWNMSGSGEDVDDGATPIA